MIALRRYKTDKFERRFSGIDKLVCLIWIDIRDGTFFYRVFDSLNFYRSFAFEYIVYMPPRVAMRRRVASWFNGKDTHIAFLPAFLWAYGYLLFYTVNVITLHISYLDIFAISYHENKHKGKLGKTQENGDYFLKTAFPSRKYTKQYTRRNSNEHS